MGDKAVTFVNGRMKKAGDTGTVDFDGNVNLGNADTDNIVFTGETGTGLSAGDIFGFALELSGGYAGTETIHFTTVVKYNPYAV